MPICINPITIRNPAVTKFKEEFKQKNGRRLTQFDIDMFCISNNYVDFDGRPTTYLTVPCGKCLYCYQNKQKDWQTRLIIERDNCECAYFVTLTYDDNSVPDNLCVSKRDCQLFLKRLRKRFGDYHIRYFLISEYGPTFTKRPHYHMCLFFPNRFFPVDTVYYDYCLPSWDKGFVEVTPLYDGRIAYISTYCIKFFNKPPLGRCDNFMLSSRRPGIGSSYLNNAELMHYHRNQLQPSTVLHGYRHALPRFLRNKIFDVNQLIKLRSKSLHWLDYTKTIKQRLKDSDPTYMADIAEYKNRCQQYQFDLQQCWDKFRNSKKL